LIEKILAQFVFYIDIARTDKMERERYVRVEITCKSLPKITGDVLFDDVYGKTLLYYRKMITILITILFCS